MSSIERLIDDQHFGNYLKEYEKLVKLHKPVDLGLGYPDHLPSKFVTDALLEVLSSTNPEDYQYTSVKGDPRLREALSTTYSPLLCKQLDPEVEILITAGSSEALYCAVTSLIAPGDEVIIIEPCFMVFVELVKMAGGVPKYLSLELRNCVSNNRTSADWAFDKAALEGLFTEKTKAIIMNTPHNPTGKVFDIEELGLISKLCIAKDVICIADEVYERMVFKPSNHLRIASLPGMFERTVTLGAAEKSFGVTGWQIGWAYGPRRLLQKLLTLHQRVVYNASVPLQIAFAKMLETEAGVSYFEEMENELREKRDYLVQMLLKTKMEPILPEGGMFVLADVSEIVNGIDLSGETGEFVDMKFVNWLARCHGLQAFPVTVFCEETSRKKHENLVRFCFTKKQQTLEEAALILSKF